MATHNNPLFSAALGILVLCLGVAFRSLRSAAKLRKIMPPGPPGLPFLGNLFQLPQFQWLRFTEWKAQYGPIISLNLGGQPVVVLNSYQVASDLLDNRSAIYSDRPRFIMGSEILTGSMLIAFMTYGDPWKKLRRAAHDGLTRQVSASYTPIQEREASILVKSMIEQPSLWDQNLRRKASAASGLLGIVYGLPSLDSTDDPLITRVDDFIRRLVRATLPGAFLVEILPVMKRLPSWMAKWKKEGLEWHRKDTILFQGIMNDAKDLARSGNLSPCFAGHLIENPRDLTEKESAWVAATMFGAGSETVAAALCVFILAMTLYPNVMRTAQAELDQVVGRDRMPSFSDRANLPYIEAIVKEVLRWRPVGPLGLPRRSVKDDRYNGYFIPKGTLVLYNVWAIHRDPEIFPDYDEFRPERYLEQPDLEYVTYGFGRRICMGKDVANNALFINIASMLSALDFAAPIDDSGNKILPSRTACVDKGLVVRPVPFECCITPRQFPVSTSSKV
ncbi:cytochrome P450 [Mycena albidolilacea]|uniref:Cytochrome P450 n=1 Tax=Mycena albidolilacea TaxID=1033008 RepID=A0AAD6Z6D4_9AGAR|nr:cytochrome P450 [Mycena albidolilacea]